MKKLFLYTLFLFLIVTELKPAEEPIYGNLSPAGQSAPALPPRIRASKEPIYMNQSYDHGEGAPALPPRSPDKKGSSASPVRISPIQGSGQLYQQLPPPVPARRASSASQLAKKELIYANAGEKEIYELVDELELEGGKEGSYDNLSLTTLMLFVAKGDSAGVKRFLNEKPEFDINVFDEDENTPLHKAAELNDFETLSVLLDHAKTVYSNQGDSPYLMTSVDVTGSVKVLVNVQDSNGKTALFYAVSNGNIEMVKLLLENGAEVDRADKKGQTADDVARDITDSVIRKEIISLLRQ